MQLNLRDGPFRLFFSREEPRIHVHVAHPDGEAKFWLAPDVHLAVNMGLSASQVRQAQAVVGVGPLGGEHPAGETRQPLFGCQASAVLPVEPQLLLH